MRRLLVMLALSIALCIGGGTLLAAAADDPPPPPSQRTLVGIMIDSKDGLTETSINCLGNGRHRTVDGDGTLFMPNTRPQTMLCIIDIRRSGSVT